MLHDLLANLVHVVARSPYNCKQATFTSRNRTQGFDTRHSVYQSSWSTKADGCGFWLSRTRAPLQESGPMQNQYSTSTSSTRWRNFGRRLMTSETNVRQNVPKERLRGKNALLQSQRMKGARTWGKKISDCESRIRKEKCGTNLGKENWCVAEPGRNSKCWMIIGYTPDKIPLLLKEELLTRRTWIKLVKRIWVSGLNERNGCSTFASEKKDWTFGNHHEETFQNNIFTWKRPHET